MTKRGNAVATTEMDMRHFRLDLPKGWNAIWCHLHGVGSVNLEPVVIYAGGEKYRLGHLYQGDNGEWYMLDPSQISLAYPVGDLDQVKGTGFKTVRECVSACMLEALKQCPQP